MLMIINDADPDELMVQWVYEFDLENFIKNSTVNVLSPVKMKKISDILNNNSGFNYQTVRSFNKRLGVFFQFVIALVRCYDYNLRYALIMNEIETKKSNQNLSQFEHTQNMREVLGKNIGKNRVWEFDFTTIPAKNRGGLPQFMIDHKSKYLRQLQRVNRDIGYEGGGFFVTNIPCTSDGSDYMDYAMGGSSSGREAGGKKKAAPQMMVFDGPTSKKNLPPLAIGNRM
jgi:hypothetical protein